MKEPTNDPSDPSLVIEVMPPNIDRWIPQMINTGGEMRRALCKTSQGPQIVGKLEEIYGKDRVRTVPLDGYEAPAGAEELRAEIQARTIPHIGSTDGHVGLMNAIKMCGIVCTFFVEHPQVVGEMPLSVVIGPEGEAAICLQKDGEVDIDNPLWCGSTHDVTEGQLRMGWSLLFQWLCSRFPTIMSNKSGKRDGVAVCDDPASTTDSTTAGAG